ncbi:MAG: 50S ribosomal protein L19e [Nitrososphaerota archaeon]
MKLDMQKRMAAKLLKCGETRVRFVPERLEDIEDAITRADVRRLINDGAIFKLKAKGVSRARVEKRRKGPGSRRGGKYAILPRKRRWINKVRAQRRYLARLRDDGVLDTKVYRRLYKLVKAGVFKSVAALEEYIKVNKLGRGVMV